MLTHGNLRGIATYRGTVVRRGERERLNPMEDALGTSLRRRPESSLGRDLAANDPMLGGQTEVDNLERRPTGAAKLRCGGQGSNPSAPSSSNAPEAPSNADSRLRDQRRTARINAQNTPELRSHLGTAV
jgi:hypothetical protein